MLAAMTNAEPELDAEITRLRAQVATLERAERERAAVRSEQAATAAVLQAISRSAFDLPTVLDTVVENATQLLGRGFSMLLRREGHLLKLAALHIVDDAERAECVVQTA